MSRFQAVSYEDQAEINLSPIEPAVESIVITVGKAATFVVNGRSMTAGSNVKDAVVPITCKK